LSGATDEIERGGGAARQALEQSFAIRETLVRKGMEEFYNEQRRSSANKAASLGRSSMDPRFQQELQNKMFDRMETVSLEMAERQALQRVGLEMNQSGRLESALVREAGFEETQGRRFEEEGMRRTAAGESAGLRQEQLGMRGAQLAESQGLRREGVAGQRVGVAERTGAGREAAARARGGLEEGLARQGVGMEQQIGMGIPASQLGIGIDVGGAQSAIRQQQLQNLQVGQGMALTPAQIAQQERLAQPTRTTTEQGSVLGGVLGAIGTVGGVAANVATGGAALATSSALRNALGN